MPGAREPWRTFTISLPLAFTAEVLNTLSVLERIIPGPILCCSFAGAVGTKFCNGNGAGVSEPT